MTWPLALVLCVCAIAIAGAYCYRRYAVVEVARQQTARTISNNERAAGERMVRLMQDSRAFFAGVTTSDNVSPLTPDGAAKIISGDNIVPFGKRKRDDNKPGGDAA